VHHLPTPSAESGFHNPVFMNTAKGEKEEKEK
jgi:hypothetical protein